MILPPHAPELRAICTPFSGNKKIIDKLWYEFRKSKIPLYGLAANQIGFTESVFIFDGDRNEAIIDPKIIGKSVNKGNSAEVCLSLANVTEPIIVPRHMTIEVEFTDKHDVRRTEILEGLESVVFQHEIDHLHGVLIIDYKNEGYYPDYMKEVPEQDYGIQQSVVVPQLEQRKPLN